MEEEGVMVGFFFSSLVCLLGVQNALLGVSEIFERGMSCLSI